MYKTASSSRFKVQGSRQLPRASSLEHRANSEGFTILELFIVITLLGLFLAAVQESLITGLRATHTADNREAVRRELANALDQFVRDVSQAQDVDDADLLDGSNTGQFQFDTPSVSNVEYSYDASADTLSYDDANVSQRIIARYVTSFDLTYVDNTGATLSEPVAGSSEDNIRVVQVTATATIGDETLTLSDAAYLRNM